MFEFPGRRLDDMTSYGCHYYMPFCSQESQGDHADNNGKREASYDPTLHCAKNYNFFELIFFKCSIPIYTTACLQDHFWYFKDNLTPGEVFFLAEISVDSHKMKILKEVALCA